MSVSTGIRRIGLVSAAAALLAVLLADSRSYAQATPATPEKGKLRILYAGHLGSDREKDFVQFLGQHFEVVKTADLSAFKDQDATGYDVTIFDYDGDGFKAPRPNVSLEFSRPLITVGVAGGLMASQWRLKTGYL